jgi:predicted DNA-binding helix-hairpin-helix protein
LRRASLWQQSSYLCLSHSWDYRCVPLQLALNVLHFAFCLYAGCFYCLAAVSKAAVNILVWVWDGEWGGWLLNFEKRRRAELVLGTYQIT